MMQVVPADPIVRANTIATAVFAIGAGAGAAVRSARPLAAVLSLAVFGMGVFAFISGYARALERSRRDEIGTANLFLLTGQTAPPDVKRVMLGLLGTQVAVAIAAAAVGFTGMAVDQVNPLAFAMLAPMCGLGMNGLWASRHGRFGPRILTPQPTRRSRRPRPEPEKEQSTSHD